MVRYCATLVSWLPRERPLDELHPLVFPVVHGRGKRLLAAPATRRHRRSSTRRAFQIGVLNLA
jgi:hypothetical protein